jgi:hypothetical protein
LTTSRTFTVRLLLPPSWIEEMSPQHARNLEDAAAELGLRNIDVPHARVRNRIKIFDAEHPRDPNAPSEALDESIDEFFAARGKPKN